MIGASCGGALDFEAVETAVRREALRVAARFLEARLNEDPADAGAERFCDCGRRTRRLEKRSRRLRTSLGEITLHRDYYHCAFCARGFCPRDRELGLHGEGISPSLARMVAAAGSAVSFREASNLLDELAGVRLNAKQVERCSEAVGEWAVRFEREVAQPEDGCTLPPTLYLGMDGTGLPMHPGELAGRAGKQKDGSAKTREAKLCTVWSAEGRDTRGRPVRDSGSATYTSAIESAATRDTDKDRSDFQRRVERESRRRRFCEAERGVILGDGAKWIWNIAEEAFPDAIQIVDRFHAKERLHRLSKAVHTNPATAIKWAEERCAELDAGDIDSILAEISEIEGTEPEAEKCSGYFEANRERMRYDLFQKQGLCTSTGIIEAGCKNVIGARLKKSGMHWSVKGANAIMALRNNRLSGRFENLCEWMYEMKAA